MNQKIAKVATNLNIIDKNIGGNDYFLGNEWINIELTIDELIKSILDGKPFCAQLLSDKRSSKNYKLTNLIAIDVDGGTTLREALEHEFSKKYLTFFYTTVRHTIEINRFRLCFIVDQAITEPEEYRSIKRALGLKYCGDPSTHDPSRISYGNKEAVYEVYEKSIPIDVFNELIEFGKKEITPDNEENPLGEYKAYSRRSNKKLARDMQLRTKSGLIIRLDEVENTTPIYCPFHRDDHPSAFVNRKHNNGDVYLHCATCETTWWMESLNQEAKRVDEEQDFVDVMKSLSIIVQSKNNERDFSKLNLRKIPHLGVGHINIYNQKFLELRALRDGLTLVRSPKGSGKTESLTEIVRDLVIQREFRSLESIEQTDFDEPPRSFRTSKKILLIGHRQALIRQLCERLDLDCYLDDDNYEYQEVRIRKNQYGVCLDSLWLVQNIKYDLVIIDECEQVLAHLLAKTMKHKEANFKILKNTIKSAKNVVALDADLSWTSYLTLTEMRDLKNPAEDKNNQVWIEINEYKASNDPIQIYASKNELIGEMMQDISNNKKLFVTSNSKRLIERLSAGITERFGPYKTLCITSSNSKSEEAQESISDFKKTYSDYDNILCSPSLGTGVDISFDDESQVVDCCYGFFESQINTHLDIDQQIRRVRHPKEVKVWINSRKFNFETEFDVINHQLLASKVISNTHIGFPDIERSEIYNENDPFLTLATHIVTNERKSKNNLKSNFINYKIKTGWNPIFTQKNINNEQSGADFLEVGKQVELREYVNYILNATPINHQQFVQLNDALEDNINISKQDYWSLIRCNIELFYQTTITNDLIVDDDRGRLRKKTRLLMSLMEAENISNINQRLEDAYLKNKKSVPYDRIYDREAKVVLLYSILSTTPIFRSGEFDSEIYYQTSDLNEFIRICKKLDKYVQAQFNFTIRSDIETKPVTQLNFFLKQLGIEVDQRKKKSGKYKILTESLDQMMELVNMRKSVKNDWLAINNIHGFNQIF